jgi:hypothetical protein
MEMQAVATLVLGTLVVLLVPALVLSGEGFLKRMRGRNRHH